MLLANNTRVQLQDLNFNDEVFTDDGPARVEGIIARPNDKHSMMTTAGIVISICQPIQLSGNWIYPIVNLSPAFNVTATSELQFDLLLEEGMSHIYISASETNPEILKCSVLAHGIYEGACEHPYFAYPQCRTDVNALLTLSVTKKLVFSERPWIDDADGVTIGISAASLQA